MKQYSIEEVLKEEKWMVLEVQGEKIVYDISNFVDDPGWEKSMELRQICIIKIK